MKAYWLGLILLAAVLTGCSPVVNYAQPIVVEAEAVALSAGDAWGQTFTARQAALSGIVLYLQPLTAGEGTLRLQLRAGPPDSANLATAVLPLSSITAPGFYPVTFAPQLASPPADYYFTIEVMGSGAVVLGGAPGANYLDGARYHNGLPDEGQLAFHLLYASPAAYLGLAAQLGQWGLWLLAGGWLFVLPGWAMLTLIGSRFDSLSIAEKFTLAGGLGLALYPVLFVLADVLKWPMGAWWAWLPGLLGIVTLTVSQRRRKLSVPRLTFPEAGLFITILIIFGIRFWVIRSMDAPAWGDSVQHVVMAQRMIEAGGLFTDWQPYAPYISLTVQFGFSAAVAVFHWLTGLNSLTATLIVGQLLNGLAVISLYPLAVRLARGNAWAGVGAVFIAGLLMPMPAMYVNWGRYAQLAGQAILLPALWLTWEALEQGRWRWRTLTLGGIVLAGLMLTYYRMPFYYAAFMAPWLVAWGAPRFKFQWRAWLTALMRLAAIGLLAGALFLPWALRLFNSALSRAVERGVARGSTLSLVRAEYASWQHWPEFVPPLLAVLALVGLVWAVSQKRWPLMAMGLWVALMAALPAGRLIRLPFASLLSSFAVLIALYIPVGLVGGWLIGEAFIWGLKWRSQEGQNAFRQIGLIGGLFGCSVWAAWTQQQIVRPEFVMLTRPDLRAMEWIEANTPSTARFLVEGFRIYNGQSAVGADGGWYIPLLTHRSNTMPSQYALLDEQPNPITYTQYVVDIVAALESTSVASSEVTRRLCEWGITHLYVGQGQGQVGVGARQLFSPKALMRNPALSLVYAHDRVSIFALQTSACSTPP